MRLFNRLFGDSRTSVNGENKDIRGRVNDEGTRRAIAGRKNLTARKLGLEALEERQLRDQIKRDYCASHGIRLVEIRYDQDIEEELKKQLQL